MLSGERVRLRGVEDSDLPKLLELLRHPEVARWWGKYDDEAKLRDEIDEVSLAWTIVVDDEVAGLLTATEETEPDYKCVRLDLFIDGDRHGKGLGSDALSTALHHFFDERGHHRAEIDPAIGNVRAIRSYKRVGFQPVGVLRRQERLSTGEWSDALLMDLLAEELDQPAQARP